MDRSCFSVTLFRYPRETFSKENLFELWSSFPVLKQLQQKLNYTFNSHELLLEAMTHRSFVNEWPDLTLPYNERLEFLGDALLGSWVAFTLFHRFPSAHEGELSRTRVALVSGKVLLPLAQFLGLPQIMLLGKGPAFAQSGQGNNIWIDGLEALLGAIYLDAGDLQWKIVMDNLFSLMQRERIIAPLEELIALPCDAKSQLQEKLALKRSVPEYRLIEEGPDGEEKRFLVALYVDGHEWDQIWSRTKKEGHQMLATKALVRLTEKKI